MAASSDPPRLAILLLRLLVRGEAREFIEGDLREEYGARIEASGGDRRAARSWFWRQSLAAGLSRLSRMWRPASGTVRRPEVRPGWPGRKWSGGAVASDFRTALRALARRPAFALVVTGILAVGVGATTSVYSVADWLLFRPVPGVGAPQDRLAVVQASTPDGNYTGISYLNLVDLQHGAPAIEALAGIAPTTVQVAGGRMEPSSLQASAVTEAYFDLLEVRAHRGRLFSPDELRADSEDGVVVISHRLWTDGLGADPAVVGGPLQINGVTYTVVGVAAKGFRGIERTGEVDLWFPAARYGTLRHSPSNYDLGRDGRLFMQTVVRLARRATPEQAQAQLREVMERLVAAYPEANEIHEDRLPTVHPGIGIAPTRRPALRRIVTTMFAVAMLLLLIACANVANLLVCRGATMEGAVAVRRALGASRMRIVRTAGRDADAVGRGRRSGHARRLVSEPVPVAR